jgi:hypothetical protein
VRLLLAQPRLEADTRRQPAYTQNNSTTEQQMAPGWLMRMPNLLTFAGMETL